MKADEWFAEVQKLTPEMTLIDLSTARKKAAFDMGYEGDTMSFRNPSIDTNPYRRKCEQHMADAYNDERVLLITEWNRNNGH